jgi:hypothetical protein
MAHLEAMTEIPRGGYICEPVLTIEDHRRVAVLKRDDLPEFEEIRNYAVAEMFDGMKLGGDGDQRLQLCPLEQILETRHRRMNSPATPVLDIRDTLQGTMTLLAQGEFTRPIKLDKLKSFFVESVTICKQNMRVGPFSDTQIMRQFNEDCRLRKSFFQNAETVDISILNAPWQTKVADPDGNIVVFRLVRDGKKVSLLGVCFRLTVTVTDLPPIIECAICLDACDADQWACVQCHNLLHHGCKEQIKTAGMSSCPYCRFAW